MNWLVVLYGVLLVAIAIGVIGAFVPALPGISVILAAVVIWGLVVGFAKVSWALGITALALLLSLIVGYLAAYLGAKKVGASRWGQIGAVAGLLLGFFGLLPTLPVGGPLVGIVLGAMLGAFVGEFIYRQDLALGARTKLCAKVSLAVVVGSLIGNVIEGILGLTSAVIFVVTTWSTVGAS
ncbi:DUF456 family protein [Romeria aff. gracilis LEGE 07310]|uniref:DUF456 family protein n=1 Tax=Vasconcelosia minhoensis LEGE 07310 TaxID=915328 RepID=A0A8J7DKX5_9CYAN|nr:DUF456 family protein [Romeria gracilis]MBE9076821.1 DUF456 family protein [Romeria aff. gracilis LEGE 07310]